MNCTTSSQVHRLYWHSDCPCTARTPPRTCIGSACVRARHWPEWAVHACRVSRTPHASEQCVRVGACPSATPPPPRGNTRTYPTTTVCMYVLPIWCHVHGEIKTKTTDAWLAGAGRFTAIYQPVPGGITLKHLDTKQHNTTPKHPAWSLHEQAYMHTCASAGTYAAANLLFGLLDAT